MAHNHSLRHSIDSSQPWFRPTNTDDRACEIIALIKEKLPNGEEHIRRKLPAMHHQFKHLAGLDITQEPMEVGPTTHYVMGGIRVDGDTQMTAVPGLFAAGEAAGGMHGSNRLGGNRLSDLLFVLARTCNSHGQDDVLWVPGKDRG